MVHSHVKHDSFICVTWLIHMCDMTHPYVWHDSFTYLTYTILVYEFNMTHLRVWLDVFIFVTWLIHGFDRTISYVWHDSFTCVTWPIQMYDMTYCNMYHDISIRDMTQTIWTMSRALTWARVFTCACTCISETDWASVWIWPTTLHMYSSKFLCVIVRSPPLPLCDTHTHTHTHTHVQAINKYGNSSRVLSGPFTPKFVCIHIN